MNLPQEVQEIIDYHFDMQDLTDNEVLVAPLNRTQRTLRFSNISEDETVETDVFDILEKQAA